MTNDKQRERLVDLLSEDIDMNLAYYVADNLLANGVIVPPCKVGDKVWVIDLPYFEGIVTECVVACFNDIDENGIGSMDYEPIEDIPDVVSVGSHIDEIGKTVFLTKEEAENALGGVQG